MAGLDKNSAPRSGLLSFSPSNLFLWGLCLTSIVLLCYAALIVSMPDGSERKIIFDVTSPLWSLLAAACLYFAGKVTRKDAPQVALPWIILALALLFNTLGDVTWAILQDFLGQEPFPSLADVFYLGYYPLFLIAILHLPVLQASRRESLLTFQDMCIVMLASILGFWNFILGPAVQAGMQDPIGIQILSLAYPVCDLVLLWAIFMLIYRKPVGVTQSPLIVLAVAATLFFLTDCLYCYLSVLGAYASGGWVDIGWIGAYLLFSLAGLMQAVTVMDQGGSTLLAGADAPRQIPNGLRSYLPYIWLVAAFLLLVASHYWPMAMDFRWMALGFGAIILIVLMRQLMTLEENSRLLLQLRGALDQLQQQASILSKTNLELQSEISERQHAEKQLAFSAQHDALTGLPNRAFLVERLQDILVLTRRRNYCCTLLYLDLDQFKVINDSLGHNAGDEILIGVASRLQSCVRAHDVVARFGGDEFVILLEDSRQMSDAILCANRILDKLKTPFEIQDRQLFLSTSIGILPSLKGYTDTEDVIRDADIAMYRAKSHGKARFEIFDPDMRGKVMARLEMENYLRHAMAREEFRLNYQPIFSLQANRLTGFEALLRWWHPLRGPVSPVEFIPLAEETGLIIPIGQWMLAQACSQMRSWQLSYPQERQLTLSVNISSRQMEHPDFVSHVRSALEDSGLKGDSLRLEITEAVCMSSDSHTEKNLRDLTSLGIHFEIDDFGTGYSSLSFLHTYPISTIKIDKAFIGKIGAGQHTGIVRAIIALARDLGMETIAEGVETEAQLSSLKEYGCTSFQGNLFSRPLDESAVARFLAQACGVMNDEQASHRVPSTGALQAG